MSSTFNFEYDATTGVLIAAALREKAEAERKAEEANRLNATLGTKMTDLYTEQAVLAGNRAKFFEDAAEAIHNPVRAAVAADMAKALREAGIVE